jgi:hypothetical protein
VLVLLLVLLSVGMLDIMVGPDALIDAHQILAGQAYMSLVCQIIF